jgi:multidrug efflux system membrane fusion protein
MNLFGISLDPRRPVCRAGILLSLGALGLVWGCARAPLAEPVAVPVRTAEAGAVQTGNSVTYSANIVPYAEVDLAFQSGGYVSSIRQVRGADGRMRDLQAGDRVTRGTVLAVVKEDQYRDKLAQAKAQLERAQAAYTRARLAFERTKTLYETQSATKPDYDSAKEQYDGSAAAVVEAEAAVSQARIALGYCSLRAPMDSWITKRSVDVGTLVGPSTAGFSLADMHAVKAVFGVPDIAMSRIKLGNLQTITTDAVSGPFDGRITAISPVADPKSRVYSVEVTIPNPHTRLKPGMIASLSVVGSELPRELLTVPLSAIIRDPEHAGGFAVLVTQGTGEVVTAVARSVQVGDSYGNMIAVTSGLKAGERVITNGATMVRSGERVRVIP